MEYSVRGQDGDEDDDDDVNDGNSSGQYNLSENQFSTEPAQAPANDF